jgi:hypothetical protein
VEPGYAVDALGVGREEQCPAVHQALEDADRAIHGPDLPQALPHGVERSDGQRVQEGTHPTLKVEVVVDRRDGLGIGIAVEELKRSQSRLDSVRRQDRRRDRVVRDAIVASGPCTDNDQS